MAADRFTFPQDLLATDSIAVYMIQVIIIFVERWVKNIIVVVVVYWFKFYFPFFGVLVVSEPLNNS